MIQATSVNCSPIKPSAVSFKSNDNLALAANWLENVDSDGFSEGNFNDLNKMSDKVENGYIKTFLKFTGAIGAAFAASKVGATKALGFATKNPTVSHSIVQPASKFINKEIGIIGEKLAAGAEKMKDKKGIKPYFTKQANNFMDWVNTYKNRGIDKDKAAIEAQIAEMRKVAQEEIGAVRKKAVREQVKAKGIDALIDARLAEKTEEGLKYQALQQKLQFLPETNLLKKTVGNGIAIGGGIGAADVFGSDKDGNGKILIEDMTTKQSA